MRVLSLLAGLVVIALPAAAQADDPGSVYPGADWTSAKIAVPDGTVLHAEILRDEDVPLDAAHKQPVIMSIGPYFNRAGQLGAFGAVNGTRYDPQGPNGPSERFADLVNGSGLLEKGYTFVMVDLRGYGGSTGCPDWGGPGEQADVKAAVEWAAAQPWSTGKVGTYGKSYDGMTGLMASGLEPEGLTAVVSQEPVYDSYRYLYGDGMRRANFAGTPALYQAIALTPAGIMDDPAYNLSGATIVDPSKPGCNAQSVAEQSGNDDHYSAYWRSRDFIALNKGSDVPLFLTQGLTEDNTVADGLEQILEAHTGPERGWLGPWEHVRGADRDRRGRLLMGREGWYDEVMSFYDQYLKGIAPAVGYPNFAVQSTDGKWRGEEQWPPGDTARYTSELNSGTYADNADSKVTGSDAKATDGVWTFSPPLIHEAHMVGSGHVTVLVRADLPRSNLAVDVYDLAPVAGGKWSGPLITRQAHLIRQSGRLDLDLWSVDWKLKRGHRIGVRVTDTNTDWWGNAIGLGQDVELYEGEITLPYLSRARTERIAGETGPQLPGYLSDKVTVPGTLVDSGESAAFVLPPAQTSAG